MVAYLSTLTNVEPLLIDIEDLASEVEPMMLATGTHTYDKIYSAIYQKTNDLNVLKMREDLNREIHQFIPSSLLAALKQKVLGTST